MKKIVPLLIFLIVISLKLYSQDYLISVYNGQTVTTCSGFFYDSGGVSANYGSGETYTVTFKSNNVINTHTKVYFHEFDIDPSDTLYVYDGPNTSSPVIGAYNNTNSLSLFPVQASISNSSGNLTFKFQSNTSLSGSGWKGEISCIPECQTVFVALDTALTIPHPTDSNYVDICFHDTITFVGTGVFPENGLVYTQSDATSTFEWDFGDGTTATGQTVTHLYTQVRGYNVALKITDSHGCVSTNSLDTRVRVADNPLASIHPIPSLCSGDDSLLITIGYQDSSFITLNSSSYVQQASQGFDSTMFIPDGPSCGINCYNTNVTFSAFTPGATISNASDILSICVNMEHSFVGDLSFELTCPNGQSAILKQYISSGGAYMGVPFGGSSHSSFDNGCLPSNNPAGDGWNYCWSQTYPNIGTLNSHSSQTQLDSTNTVNNTGYYVPDQNFSQLIGCPLNGTWNIQICDNWAIDNGYIFDWTLNLESSLLPTNWSYSVHIDSMNLTGNNITELNDSTFIFAPDTGGSYNYTVTVYNSFGCSYDTSFVIIVTPKPVINLGNDTSICEGSIVTLDAGNPGSDSYLWDDNEITQTIQVNQTGTYVVTVTNINGALQCISSDSIDLKVFPIPIVDLGPDTCIETGITLDAGAGTDFIYDWSTNATTQTINVNSTGIYYVEVQSGTGSPCFEYDTVVVKAIPIPTPNLGFK